MQKKLADIGSWALSLVTFTLAFLGILFQPVTLQRIRPTVPPNESTTTDTSASKLARMWDDPFVIFPSKALEYSVRMLPFSKAPTLILGILVPTPAYPEESEFRLRHRFAVQAALRDAGYIPESPGRLFSVPAPFTTHSSAGCYPASGDVISTERFILKPTETPFPSPMRPRRFCSVQILWIPQESLTDDSPATTCSHLKTWIHTTFAECKDPYLAVIGPHDSDMLARMISPDQDTPTASDVKKFDGNGLDYPIVISPLATAADDFVRLLALHDTSRDAFYQWNFKEVYDKLAGCTNQLVTRDGYKVVRLAPTDDKLCEALWREIGRRSKLQIFEKRNRILIISEWDTLYGRSAALTFQALKPLGNTSKTLLRRILDTATTFDILANTDPENDGVRALKTVPTDGSPFEIRLLYYLKGLDGASSLYAKRYAQSPDNRKDNTTDTQSYNGSVEPALGTTQYDYMRRILHEDSRWNDNGERFPLFQDQGPDEVIIFASDIFDKLAIIKLLRSECPRALILTTDMDALYWHPNFISYTRNVVVASPSWLWPESADAPSVVFRDSYQTSTYYAVLDAIGRKSGEILPRLSEVGNSRPIPLPRLSSSQDKLNGFALLASLPGLLKRWLSTIPESVSPFPALLIQLFVVILAVLFLLTTIRIRALEARRLPKEFFDAAEKFFFSPLLARFRGVRRIYEKIESEFTKTQSIHKSTRKNLLESIALEEALLPADKSKALGEHLGAKTRIDRAAKGLAKGAAGIQSFLKQEIALREMRLQMLSMLSELEENRDSLGPRTELEIFRSYLETRSVPRRRIDTIIFYCIIFLIVLGPFVLPFVSPTQDNGQSVSTNLFVNPETTGAKFRFMEVCLSTFALLLTTTVTAVVLREQFAFYNLIGELATTLGAPSGLSNRQTVAVIADASDPVALLSVSPCMLIGLLILSHLRLLNGLPMSTPFLLLVVGLGLLLLMSFNFLRQAAKDAKEKANREYAEDIVTAARMETRLASITKDNIELQDDLSETSELVRMLIERNSFDINHGAHEVGSSNSSESAEEESQSKEADVPASNEVKLDLRNPDMRATLLAYLDKLKSRNDSILRYLKDLESGALAPIQLGPILGAFLLPIGAGGLTLLDYLLRLFR